MVIIIFSLCFLTVFLITKSYNYCNKYYSTILYVSLISILYTLICRGYLVWHYPDWGFFTDKLNFLLQAVVLFPLTTVLFLRYLPQRLWIKPLYLLGFIGLYAGMEGLMLLRGEIIYAHGWSFGWSIFVDFFLFTMLWVHSRNWKVTLPISVCVILFLVFWFRIPLTG